MKSEQRPGRILVVDDNKVNRTLLTHSLHLQGHTVETAEDGNQALEKLHQDNFDLVLLDIEMPKMNGYQTLEACMGDPALRDVPVIMTSSLDELESVVKCIELGAEDYLTKPLNPILLKARVNASLEKKFLRDQQRNLFRTFATEQVADQLMRDGFSLGGKYVQASVMFADICSFTSISESHDPVEIIELLNDYFALMFGAIIGHGGTVNQIEGDGLMAVFGTPVAQEDHCEQAVRTAIEMLELLDGFNERQNSLGKVPLQIGIGIASGQMIAGYTGTQYRATFTCVGDTVNLAARIEQRTRLVKRWILIDQYTRNGLPDSISSDPLGPVLFRGKQQPIHIFAVKGAG